MTYVPAAGGLTNPVLGAQIFGWNKADLTQFETGTLYTFLDDLAGAHAGSMTPSYNSNGFAGLPTIDMAATGLRGGIMMRVDPNVFTLPEHYWLYCRVVGISGTASDMSFCLGMFGNIDDPGGRDEWRGIAYHRTTGSSTEVNGLTTIHGGSGSQIMRGSGIVGTQVSMNTWNAQVEAEGGQRWLIEVKRQAGANPNDWFYTGETGDRASFDRFGLARTNVSSSADTSPDWDSEDMDNLAIGNYVSSTTDTGTVKVLDLRVFEPAAAA